MGWGWKSTLLKGKKWGELPSLLRSCYFTRNLLWPGSAAGAICSLLGNAYINYRMNLTGARFRQLQLWFTVHITWHKKANATSGSATAEGWVISEKKGVAEMPSGRSAPDNWSPPIKIRMSSMLNSINPWHHCILEAPCKSRPSPWETMRWPRKGSQKGDRDRQGCGRAALREGTKLPVTSQPGKEAEKYDRSLRRQEWHRALKRECYSTKAIVSSKQVNFFLFSCGT